MNTDPSRASDKSKVSCPTCGLVVEATAERCPRDGTILFNGLSRVKQFAGKYEFISLLGSGGMGVIYKARQLGLEKFVAIKMMHQHVTSPESLRRFNLEGRATASLSHPNIVTVHDFDITESGTPYLVMDYIDGTTLSTILTLECQLKQERFMHLFIQVCDAIGHAHKRGILHRDIKPSNIMVVEDAAGIERIRIMDFGLAKILGEDEFNNRGLTGSGEMLGSPVYMSPEQAQSAKLDERSDLYSLGCVMYEALTGTPPFIGNSPVETLLMHAQNTPLPLKEASLGTPINYKLERLVLKLLNKNPADRYQNMDAVVADLFTIGAGTHSEIEVSTRGLAPDKKVPAKQTGISSTVLIAIGALAVGACIAGSMYFFKSSTRQNAPSKPQQEEVKEVERLDVIKDKIADQTAERNETIDLSEYGGRHITAKHLALLTDPACVLFVKNMNLNGLDVQDSQLKQIATLPLHRLFLNQNPIKDLSGLTHGAILSTLEQLSLNDTQCDSTSLPSIAKFPKLTQLNLAGSRLVDADVAALGEMKLKSLDVSGCDLSAESIAKLRALLPHCRIEAGKKRAPAVSADQVAAYRHTAQELQKEKRWINAAGAWGNYLATQIRETEQLGNDYAHQADCYNNASKDVAAVGCYEIAAQILERQAPQSRELPPVYVHLADTANLTKDYAEALKYDLRCMELIEQNPGQDPGFQAQRVISQTARLGATYENLHNQVEADRYDLRSSKTYFANLSIFDARQRYEAANYAMFALWRLKKYDQAIALARENLSVNPAPGERAALLIHLDHMIKDQKKDLAKHGSTKSN